MPLMACLLLQEYFSVFRLRCTFAIYEIRLLVLVVFLALYLFDFEILNAVSS